MAVFVPAESRTDSEEELAARLNTGSPFASCAPAFRRPLAVGIGVVTVLACTTFALLAAGSGSKQVSTAATAIQDLDELLEAVQDDLSGGGLLGDSLDKFLSDDEDDDVSSLLDEDAEEDPFDEAHEDAFSRRLQQKWGMPVAGVPKASQAVENPWAAKKQMAGVPKAWQAAENPWAAKKQRKMRLHAVIQSAFEEADKDHSGFLEVHELSGAASLAHQKLKMSVTRQELAAEVDTIWNDGKLGPKEFCHVLHHLMLFKKLDQDGNGMIQGLELDVLRGLLKRKFGVSAEKYHQLSTAAGASPAGKIAPPVLARVLAEAEEASVPPGIAKWFQKMDTDANGKIEGEELESLMTTIQRKFSLSAQSYGQLLDSVDSNNDRKLTPLELKHMVFRGLSFTKEQNPTLKQLPPRLALFFIKSDLNGDGVIAGQKEVDHLSGIIMRKFQITPPRYHELVQEVDHNENGLGPLELQHMVQNARQENGMKPVEKSHTGAVEVVKPGAQKNLRAPAAWQPVSNQAF